MMPLAPGWFFWKVRFSPWPGWQGLVIWPLKGGAGEPLQRLGLCQRVHDPHTSRFKMTLVMGGDSVTVK